MHRVLTAAHPLGVVIHPQRVVARLRWASCLALSAMVAGLAYTGAASSTAVLSAALLLVLAASNGWLAQRNAALGQRPIALVILLDVLLLTLLLGLNGGPANPFSILYLGYVMLAAILAGSAWTWTVVVTTTLLYGLLFLAHVPLHPMGGHAGGHPPGASFSLHLQGMWLAYAVAAATLGGFISQLSNMLRKEREARARAAHVLGLATLAAGAAHEIGNPLGTIRVAAGELHRDLLEGSRTAGLMDDIELIQAEVTRAHQVLERMAAGAGELLGETPGEARVEALLREAAHLADGTQLEGGEHGKARVIFEPDGPLPPVRWPVQAVSQSIAQLLRNALLADPSAEVVCAYGPRAGGVDIRIIDRGPGMPQSVLDRLGEPFFTTRPREGRGLGLFIARSLITHLGGQLEVESERGKGTRVRVWLPLGLEAERNAASEPPTPAVAPGEARSRGRPSRGETQTLKPGVMR